jgi:hypothetical protein
MNDHEIMKLLTRKGGAGYSGKIRVESAYGFSA